MELLNRATTQLTELYRSMTPGSRMTAGLLVIVVAVSLGYLTSHQMAAPESDLMHGVPVAASQLPLMEAAFAKANLKGYETRGTSIFVPHGQESAYMKALTDAKALPPNFGDATAGAINDTHPFMSNREREERLKGAKQQELALSIRSMSGIENAYVMYDVDLKPGFGREKLITATVSVKPLGTVQLEASRVQAIRHLVAGAIAGLKPENVTVSDLNGPTWYGNATHGAAEDNAYIALQRTYEQDLKAKILNALGFIPNVTVEPSVTLDRVRTTRGQQPQRAGTTGRREATARSGHSANRSTQAAMAAQHPNTTAVLNALWGTGGNSEPAIEPNATNAAGNEPAEKESVGLTPVLARVSVGVPMSYFKSIWQQRSEMTGRGATNADLQTLERIRVEESAKIQRHVAQLLPPAEGIADLTQLVTVTTFQDIAPVAPEFRDRAIAWLAESWRTLGLLFVGLVALLVLRSMVRVRPPMATETNSVESDAAEEPVETPLKRAQPSGPHFRTSERVLREELSELVQDDPDAAAQILRTWIGQAS